jgi:V-type H+-transporting ATPase subunit a
LNPELTPFQRRYVSFVKRCDELERKLRYFANECEKFELDLEPAGTIDSFLDTSAVSSDDKTGAQLLESMEVELEGYETQLRELNKYSEKLTIEYNEKVGTTRSVGEGPAGFS